MQLIRGIHNLRLAHRGSVATIGNFDGVHLGHQAVIKRLIEKADELDLPSVVITFEPLPREFLAPATASQRLTRLRERLAAFQCLHVDRVLCLKFDSKLARMSAREFIDRILVAGLDVHYVVLGDDFRFGREREGNFKLLQAAGRQHGFHVVTMPTFTINGERVSSTRVRQALQHGDLSLAARLLGRPYAFCGRVRRGDRLGRTLGYPTANLKLTQPLPPVQGIFAVAVHGLEHDPLRGVASIGNRPTVNGVDYRLEVYLLDFEQDIYGRHLQVELKHKIRDEMRFASLEAMKQQIARDIIAVRKYFNEC